MTSATLQCVPDSPQTIAAPDTSVAAQDLARGLLRELGEANPRTGHRPRSTAPAAYWRAPEHQWHRFWIAQQRLRSAVCPYFR